MGSAGARHDAATVVTPEPPPPRRARLGGLQIAFIAAIVLAVAGAMMFPFGRTPKIVEVMPGHGPAAKARGWDEARAAFPAHEGRDRGAVVFAGDSITAWWGDMAEAFPGTRVANRGIAGDTSRTLLYRFEADILALEPRAIVILVGTNDLHLGARPADVAFNVREMLDFLQRKRPGTPVILCAVMPRAPEPGRFPELLLDVNAQLKAMAAARADVTWCDTWEPFVTETGSVRKEEFPDGLHLAPAAYAKWAEALRAAFKEAGLEPD